MALLQTSIRRQSIGCDVTMVRHCCAYNSISVRIYFIFCYAIYCIVNTSFRRLWLSTCHHDVVMQAAQFSLFFYFNYQQTKRSFIVKFNDNLCPRWRGSPKPRPTQQLRGYFQLVQRASEISITDTKHLYQICSSCGNILSCPKGLCHWYWLVSIGWCCVV